MNKKMIKEIVSEILIAGEKIASVTLFDDTSAGVVVVCGVIVDYYYVDIKRRYLSRQRLSTSKVFDSRDWSDMIHWDRYTK